jgi:hypothetical protein
MIIEGKDKEMCLTFCIPKQCPSLKPISYIEQEINQQIVSITSGTGTPQKQGICAHSPDNSSNLHLKRKMIKTPLVCTDVRSERPKVLHNGFKASSCNNKICLCCETKPPTLSSKAIRSLGKDFWKILTNKLTDDNLKKKQKKAPGPSIKQGGKINKSKKSDDDAKPSKKKSKNNWSWEYKS